MEGVAACVALSCELSARENPSQSPGVLLVPLTGDWLLLDTICCSGSTPRPCCSERQTPVGTWGASWVCVCGGGVREGRGKGRGPGYCIVGGGSRSNQGLGSESDLPREVRSANSLPGSDPHVWGFLALGPRAPWGPTVGPPQGPGRAWPAPQRCSRSLSSLRFVCPLSLLEAGNTTRQQPSTCLPACLPPLPRVVNRARLPACPSGFGFSTTFDEAVYFLGLLHGDQF